MDISVAKKLGQAFRLGVAFAKGRNYTANMAMDRWITIHPWGKGRNADYARIFIDDDTGIIQGGAGGKFDGKTLKEAFTKQEDRDDYNPARLPGERKEVAPIKAGNKEFKDGAQAETAAFMDAFKDGMKGAKNLMDFERYGQGALQKALDTLPDGAVFVSNYEYGYYQKKDGTWYKKDFDDPYSEGGREKHDITEPPSFADIGMMGKVHFGIGGTLEQAEANKQQYDILGAKKPKKPRTPKIKDEDIDPSEVANIMLKPADNANHSLLQQIYRNYHDLVSILYNDGHKEGTPELRDALDGVNRAVIEMKNGIKHDKLNWEKGTIKYVTRENGNGAISASEGVDGVKSDNGFSIVKSGKRYRLSFHGMTMGQYGSFDKISDAKRFAQEFTNNLESGNYKRPGQAIADAWEKVKGW